MSNTLLKGSTSNNVGILQKSPTKPYRRGQRSMVTRASTKLPTRSAVVSGIPTRRQPKVVEADLTDRYTSSSDSSDGLWSPATDNMSTRPVSSTLPPTSAKTTKRAATSPLETTTADDDDVEEPGWNCTRCTFLNHAALMECECCSGSRLQQDASLAAGADDFNAGDWNSLPTNWSLRSLPQPDISCRKVTLQPADPEYIEIQQSIMKTASTSLKRIVEIIRIENPTLWQLYSVKHRQAASASTSSTAEFERLLWHGTAEPCVDRICRFGFNRSYCGKNATAYGKGVYFGTQFAYSANPLYSPPDARGYKHIFRCRVLVGDYALGSPTYIEPPAKRGKLELYDSVVNDVRNPSIFVVFHDAQTYPEYEVVFI